MEELTAGLDEKTQRTPFVRPWFDTRRDGAVFFSPYPAVISFFFVGELKVGQFEFKFHACAFTVGNPWYIHGQEMHINYACKKVSLLCNTRDSDSSFSLIVN